MIRPAICGIAAVGPQKILRVAAATCCWKKAGQGRDGKERRRDGLCCKGYSAPRAQRGRGPHTLALSSESVFLNAPVGDVILC